MMKKASLYILLGACALVAVVAGWIGWSMKAESKAAKESSLDKAREGKAKLKELRIEADELGIDYFGLSSAALEQEIENHKSKENGEDIDKADSTSEEKELG